MNSVTKTRWPVVLVGFLTGAVGAMQVGKAPPVVGILSTEFELTMTMAGWVLSTVALTGAAIGLLAGSISDRVGHRRTIQISLILVIAGCLMGAVSGDVTWLLLSRVLEGTGFIGIVVSVPSILMRVTTPSDTRLVFGIWAGYMPMGMAIMMALVPYFLMVTDWRGIWIANAVITGGMLIVFGLSTRGLEPRKDPDQNINPLTAIVRVLSRPGPWLLAACFLFYAGQWAALMAWLPTFLTRISGSDLSLAALLTALVVLVNVPGNILGGWLLQRGFTRWHLVAVGSLCMALSGYVVFMDGVSDAVRVISAIAFSFLGGLLPSTLLGGSVLHSPVPALVGTTNGVILNGANSGTLLGPPALGTLVALLGGWQASGVAIAASGGIIFLLAILLGLVEKNLTQPS